jgi:hypothetical protein
VPYSRALAQKTLYFLLTPQLKALWSDVVSVEVTLALSSLAFDHEL